MKATLVILLVLVVVLFFTIDYCSGGPVIKEGMKVLDIFKHDNSKGFTATADEVDRNYNPNNPLGEYFSNLAPEVPNTTSFFQDVPVQDENQATSEFGKQMSQDLSSNSFNIKDFLPQEYNQEWFQTDITAGKEIDQGTLIDISKICQGVDTIGQSLKNASRDLRGNIPNPKIVVSPFLNSSYEPDTNIKSWC